MIRRARVRHHHDEGGNRAEAAGNRDPPEQRVRDQRDTALPRWSLQ